MGKGACKEEEMWEKGHVKRKRCGKRSCEEEEMWKKVGMKRKRCG